MPWVVRIVTCPLGPLQRNQLSPRIMYGCYSPFPIATSSPLSFLYSRAHCTLTNADVVSGKFNTSSVGSLFNNEKNRCYSLNECISLC